MSPDDAIDNGQPESCSLQLGREEWLEHLGLNLWRNPVAVVDHFESDASGKWKGTELDRTGARIDRLEGILHEVDEDLSKLLGVEVRHRKVIGDLLEQLDGFARLDRHSERGPHELLDRGRRSIELAVAREVEQIANDLGAPVELGVDDLPKFRDAPVGLEKRRGSGFFLDVG